jgi:predicted nucleotidyltransferase
MMKVDRRAQHVIREQPYPLVFLTISGAHLYGFPSGDSDIDLRGAHVLPLEEVVGLRDRRETIEAKDVRDGLEVELVTHDVEKFFRLLLKKNGYVLEQLYSPLVARTTPEHEELKEIARGCITKFHAHHYLGFSRNQWALFEKEAPPRAKPLLYVYRVLLTGIHLMRTGDINANLVELNETFRLPYVPELIERKAAGGERAKLADTDVQFHRTEFERLTAELEASRDASTLPEVPSATDALNDLLVRIRMSLRQAREAWKSRDVGGKG